MVCLASWCCKASVVVLYEIVEEASCSYCLSGSDVHMSLWLLVLEDVFRWPYQYQPVNHFVEKGQTHLVSLLLGLWEGILGQEVPYTRRVG